MNEYPQPGLHPDADTLSAFAEGVLPEHERLACLGHFVECAACRDVVYLAQEPLLPEAVPVAAHAAWWKQGLKPIVGLSAAALAAVLVLSIAHYRPEKPAVIMPMVASGPRAPSVESPHSTPPRTSRTTPTIVQRSVSAQALSRPEALLALPQRGLDNGLSINGALSGDAPSAIAGTITDPTGAVIAGAAVTVRQTSGAPGANTVTDKLGRFLVAGLQQGQYELKVTSPGFQSVTKKLETQPGRMVRADSSLSVGSTAETVEVTASAAAVDTLTSSLTTNTSAFRDLSSVGRIVATTGADSVSLPSKLAAIATASKDKVILAADSGGGLYRSDNAGKKWKGVKAVWQGKVVELAVEAAQFRLTTDMGIAWFSRDGSRWHSAPPRKQ